LRVVASRSGDVAALTREVEALVGRVGLKELSRIFEDDVRPYLSIRYGDGEAARKTDFYFGSPGSKDGQIHSLAGRGAPATAGN
jgi:hypothetical protein